MIPKDEWHWTGYQGHLISTCRFFLTTRVGNYRISTVGDYRDRHGKRETIGIDRYFETMVFELADDGTPEGEVKDFGSSADYEAYQESRDAEVGHHAMCEKFAKSQPPRTGAMKGE